MIIKLERQEADLTYMSLAQINTKKAAPAKKKVFKSLRDSIHNLRNQISAKKTQAPDVFDLAKGQGKRGAKR